MQKGARSICFRFQQLFPTLLSFTSKSRKLVARFNVKDQLNTEPGYDHNIPQPFATDSQGQLHVKSAFRMLSQRCALFLQMPILIQMCSRLEVANRKIARKQTKPNIPNGVVHLGRWEAVQEHTRKSSKHAGYAMPAL